MLFFGRFGERISAEWDRVPAALRYIAIGLIFRAERVIDQVGQRLVDEPERFARLKDDRVGIVAGKGVKDGSWAEEIAPAAGDRPIQLSTAGERAVGEGQSFDADIAAVKIKAFRVQSAPIRQPEFA